MSGVVRLLLIWFIAAAVPLKGLAAVTMAGCGPGHHSPREAAEIVQLETHGDLHEVRGDIRSRDAGAGSQGVETVPDSSTGQSAQLKMKCSSCAPCCSVAAPASERASISQTDSASTAVTFLEIRLPEVVADVPHRPPRLILA
jgi:hypothetical protein